MTTLVGITYDDYLEHYGVKGMKWGVRKAETRPSPKKAKRLRDDAAFKKAADAESAMASRLNAEAKRLRKQEGVKRSKSLAEAEKRLGINYVKEMRKIDNEYKKDTYRSKELFNKERKEMDRYRQDERDKVSDLAKETSLTTGLSLIAFPPAAFVTTAVGSKKMYEAQGFSKGKATAAAMFPGPIGNVAVAELNARRRFKSAGNN